MQFYFLLQFRRFKRWSEEMGVPVVLSIVLLVSVFSIASYLLFNRLEIAPWIYTIIFSSLILSLGERRRIVRLKLIFQRTDYLKIRLIENGMIWIPFSICLCFFQNYNFSFSLFLLALGSSFLNINNNWNRVVPTPLKRFPFESIVGFRKTFLIIIIAYFVIFKAIQVDNYNLGIVTIGFLFLLMMSFYLKPEPKYFVWIYASKSNVFLRKKTLTAIICASILIIPALIALLIAFQSYYAISLGVSFIGFIYLFSMIIAKYSAYPNEIGVPQGILYALSLWFPPLLLLVLPIFYKKSIQKLEPILE